MNLEIEKNLLMLQYAMTRALSKSLHKMGGRAKELSFFSSDTLADNCTHDEFSEPLRTLDTADLEKVLISI